jgi:8-oxo-dGTP pyrophosphatase MutT (NUDIX family)
LTEPQIRYVWHDAAVPAGLPVTQVYGWLLCPETGRILIQERDEGTCSLPAGMPEPFDDGLAATLAREAFEENQVRIGPGPVYLGYQEVHEPGRPATPRSGWPASSLSSPGMARPQGSDEPMGTLFGRRGFKASASGQASRCFGTARGPRPILSMLLRKAG